MEYKTPPCVIAEEAVVASGSPSAGKKKRVIGWSGFRKAAILARHCSSAHPVDSAGTTPHDDW